MIRTFDISVYSKLLKCPIHVVKKCITYLLNSN